MIHWIDDQAGKTSSLSESELVNTAMIVSGYQFGMRPKQIGMVRLNGCSVRRSSEDSSLIVHISFPMIKQHDNRLQQMPLVRKVKREWSTLFLALVDRLVGQPADVQLFGASSAWEVSTRISGTLLEILGRERTTYDLRHSAAQRMVDAGACADELADFLGHSSKRTCSIYFDTSASQAQRVNEALGISTIYGKVIRIAKERFISNEELAALKGDQQVAGVPHGIPISGIGGCSSGHCLNSFTVSPCPKHLECFAGCRHLSATNLPENRRNLHALKLRFEDALQKASDNPTNSVGRENQIKHATVRLDGVKKLLATPDGEKPFPDGEDFSQRHKTRSVLDGPSS